MSTYVLDTGIILGYAKGTDYAKYVDKTHSISTPPNIGVISVVTRGEMLSLAKQRGWGHVKARALHELLNTIPTIDINNLQILDAYAEIDAYSQGKCTLHICRPCLQQETWGKTIFGLLQLPPS